VAQLITDPDGSREFVQVHGVLYDLDDRTGLDTILDMADAAHTHYDAAGQPETRHVHALPAGSHNHQVGQVRMVTGAVEGHAALLATVGYGAVRAELVDVAGEIGAEDLANLPGWAIQLFDRVTFVVRAAAEAITMLGHMPDPGSADKGDATVQPDDPR
jgi:hypothetical protein